MFSEKKVVRVDEKEFELDDGSVYPHPVELDEVPTVEEFQEIYDYWGEIFDERTRKTDKH